MSVEKLKVVIISRDPAPAQMMIDQKELLNVEHSKYLGRMTRKYARCRSGISAALLWQKQHSVGEDSFHWHYISSSLSSHFTTEMS